MPVGMGSSAKTTRQMSTHHSWERASRVPRGLRYAHGIEVEAKDRVIRQRKSIKLNREKKSEGLGALRLGPRNRRGVACTRTCESFLSDRIQRVGVGG